MADETTTTGTTQDTGTGGTATSLLTGSTETSGSSDQKTGATTETKTDATSQTDTKDGQAAGKDKDGKGDEKPSGAPEKYEFKMPDGITLDAKAVEAFEPVARELGLTNEQAQKLVDIQAGMVKAQAEAYAVQVQTWQTEVKSDPEIGGKNLDASLNAAKAVLKQFGNENTLKVLDQTGMGNHPELIRLLAKVGKAMADDTFKFGSAGATEDTPEAMARRMFPNSLKQK